MSWNLIAVSVNYGRIVRNTSVALSNLKTRKNIGLDGELVGRIPASGPLLTQVSSHYWATHINLLFRLILSLVFRLQKGWMYCLRSQILQSSIQTRPRRIFPYDIASRRAEATAFELTYKGYMVRVYLPKIYFSYIDIRNRCDPSLLLSYSHLILSLM